MMRYEQFLFTRNQERDFTAFVRPSALSNKDVSAIGNIFNYVHEVARLARSFPSIYCFPMGEYYLLVRHYNSGRRHAGRAIGVIEGIAVHQSDGAELAVALPSFIADINRLNVLDGGMDINQQSVTLSPLYEWHGSKADRLPNDEFVADFLTRIDGERLYLPFSRRGLRLLQAVLSYQAYSSPPLFAFGTNSSVLGEFDARDIAIDMVSYFNTDVPAYRSRQTGQRTGIPTPMPPDDDDDDLPAPSMALRPSLPDDVIAVSDDTQPELLGERPVTRAAPRPREQREFIGDDSADETPLLTIREMRDRIRAETQKEPPPAPSGFDPLRWIVRLFEALVSPKHK
ncbi:MAG: hypothetical protein IAE80_12810 [Anaerolinea sp.]|nr:hypothetical protein [Anaerolinea sp.]